jgi:hypothetical protein
MSISAESIKELINAELSKVLDHRVVDHIRNLLVEPTVVMRKWDYGDSNTMYECWDVLNEEDSSIGIAYSEFGFGPKSPWGLVWTSGSISEMSIGMDCEWFVRFLDAYFDSAASDLHIWRVFKQVDEPYPGIPLTEETDWDSAWKKVYELRESDGATRYNHHHSIKY